MREEAGRAYDELNEAKAKRAQATASAAVAALSNNDGVRNINPLGPAPQLTFIGPAVTPKVSGKFMVIGTISVTDATVDDTCTVQLYRDPTSATGAPGGTPIGAPTPVAAGHTSGIAAGFAATTDSVGGPPFAAHHYGISIVSATGANLSLADFNAELVIVELPG